MERQKVLNIKSDVSVFLPLSSCMKFETFLILLYRHIGPVGLYYILPHCLINVNGTSFFKKLLSMSWFSLQLFSETLLTIRRIQRNIIITVRVYWYSCKVSVILVRFQWKLNILETFSRTPQISNFMKIRPVGAELYHTDRPTYRLTDGRTDRYYEANNRSSQFCKRALNTYFYLFSCDEHTWGFEEANKHKHLSRYQPIYLQKTRKVE